jgi:hypothetical protein
VSFVPTDPVQRKVTGLADEDFRAAGDGEHYVPPTGE